MFTPAFWFVAGLILAALEMIAPGFVVIWFGVAAIATGVIAFFVSSPIVQLLVFAVLSAVLVLTSQLVARRLTRPEPEPTGASRLQGARGSVIVNVGPQAPGRVRVLGEEWRATADVALPAGSAVRVREVVGTQLLVEPWEERSNP